MARQLFVVSRFLPSANGVAKVMFSNVSVCQLFCPWKVPRGCCCNNLLLARLLTCLFTDSKDRMKEYTSATQSNANSQKLCIKTVFKQYKDTLLSNY